MTVQNPHDRFFRDSFGRLEIARSYLEEYLLAELRRLLDLDSLTPQEGSFIDEDDAGTPDRFAVPGSAG